jgi:hypothetical protein
MDAGIAMGTDNSQLTHENHLSPNLGSGNHRPGILIIAAKFLFLAIFFTLIFFLVPPALSGYRFLLGLESDADKAQEGLTSWNEAILDNPDNPVWRFVAVKKQDVGTLPTDGLKQDNSMEVSRSILLNGLPDFLVLREKIGPDGSRVGEFGRLSIPMDELPLKFVSLGFVVSNQVSFDGKGWKLYKNGKEYLAEIRTGGGEGEEESSVWLLIYQVQ